MICYFRLLFVALALVMIAGPERAFAHPHVWVTVKTELVYAPDGTVTAVRHHWTFDEMFSTFATQGLDTNKDGKLSREELKGLAEVKVTSLKEFDYFTYANGVGSKTAFNDAADYWLEHQSGLLTLHFTLTPKTPLKARRCGSTSTTGAISPISAWPRARPLGSSARLPNASWRPQAPIWWRRQIRRPTRRSSTRSTSRAIGASASPARSW